MARPRVADGGNGFQLWKVAANKLNKQTWATDKGWSSSLGVGKVHETQARLTLNVTNQLLAYADDVIDWEVTHTL
jgi:hypothetical protein